MVTEIKNNLECIESFFNFLQSKDFIDEDKAKIDLGLSEEKSSSMGLKHAIELFLEDCAKSAIINS